MPAVLHPAAHDEPCPVPAGLPRDLRRRRRHLLPHGGRAPAGAAHLSGGRPAPDRARAWGWASRPGPGGPGARSWASATGPTWSAWAGWTSTRARRCWPPSSPPTRSATPDPWPWPWSARSRSILDRTPTWSSPGRSTRPTSGTSSATRQVAVSPSALESFSLVVLEAWVDRVPVVVNATCDPTREHCERSGGGLWFASYREFEGVLDRLLADPRSRRTGWERPGLRRSLLPVAGAHRPLRRLPDHRRRAGPGHARAAVSGVSLEGQGGTPGSIGGVSAPSPPQGSSHHDDDGSDGRGRRRRRAARRLRSPATPGEPRLELPAAFTHLSDRYGQYQPGASELSKLVDAAGQQTAPARTGPRQRRLRHPSVDKATGGVVPAAATAELEQAMAQVVEAFRFLSARVCTLEERAALRGSCPSTARRG